MSPSDYRAANDAIAHISAVVHWRPLSRHLRSLAAKAPARSRRAMGRAVAWWHANTVKHEPVRPTNNRDRKTGKFRSVGRGFLRKTTAPFVEGSGAELVGGLKFGAPYALWLIAGTERIAGGRVLRWRPGNRPITSWPAKSQGGSPQSALPVALPWREGARSQLIAELSDTVTR